MSDDYDSQKGGISTPDDDDFDKEIAALAAVIKALGPLETKSRNWVFDSARRKFGLESNADYIPATVNKSDNIQPSASPFDNDTHSNPKVQKWLKAGGLEQDHIDAVFYKSGDQYELIASNIPGKSKKDQTINSYVLVGASKFLETGDAAFTDKEAREFCVNIGCYDGSNHSKYMGEKGNLLAGNKNSGWTLTAPGLKAAASLIKDSQ